MANDDFIGQLFEQGGDTQPSVPSPSSGDFIGKLIGETPSPSEVRAKAEVTPGPWGLPDVMAQGATLGGYAPALAYARSKLYGTEYGAERERLAQAQSAYERGAPTTALVGELAGSLPTTIAAMGLGQEYAAAPLAAKLASFAPRAAEWASHGAGVLPWMTRAGGRLANWSAQGALAEMSQMGLTNEDMQSALMHGAGVGAVLGPVGGALAKPLAAATEPYVRDAAQKFQALGNRLYPGQLPGAPMVTRAMGTAPTGKQIDDLTRGVAKTLGEDTNALTPEVLYAPGGAFDRAGATIENGARGATIPGNDPQMIGAMHQTLQRAASEYGGTDSLEFRRVANLFGKIANSVGNDGNLSGKSYADLTQKGSDLWNAMSRTSPNRPFALELKDALDDALERNNPAAAKEIAQGRHMWHNAIIADEATDAEGKIIPNKLYSSVVSGRHYGSTVRASQKAGVATDLGDIGTLAQGAKLFLSGKPGGLTGLVAQHPGAAIGAAAGAAPAYELAAPYLEHLTGSHPMVQAAGLGLGAGYIGAGALMNSPMYANMLMRGYNPLAQGVAALPTALGTYGYGQGAGR